MLNMTAELPFEQQPLFTGGKEFLLTAEVIHLSSLASGTNNSFLSLCLRCLKVKMLGWFIIYNVFLCCIT